MSIVNKFSVKKSEAVLPEKGIQAKQRSKVRIALSVLQFLSFISKKLSVDINYETDKDVY